MKTIKLIALFLFLHSPVFSQELTGLWMGELVNDSTKKKQSYELALSEYKGKVSGYSYTTFIENDTFYYSIKQMKANRKDSTWIVEDDEMIANNFPARAAKGVRQINTFHLNNIDSTWHMDGTWKTNQTKKYYSISGTMQMHVEKELSESSLISHLEELKLANTVVFYQPEKIEKLKPITNEIVKTQTIATSTKPKGHEISGIKPELHEPVSINIVQDQEIKKTDLLVTQTTVEPTKEQPKIIKDPAPVNNEKVAINDVQTKTENNSVSYTPENVKTEMVMTNASDQPKKEIKTNSPRINNIKTAGDKNNVVVKTDKASTTNQPVIKTETITEGQLKNKETASTKIIQPPIKESVSKTSTITANSTRPDAATGQELNVSAVVKFADSRKMETIQTVYYKNDSLVLSLYDNGVVDGDSVSVIFNGEVILSKQKLSEAALKKTIYITAGTPDSVQLVLFAENLGSIPPNTGLLIIRDGEERYQIRFSADLQKNAAIVFRKQK